MAVIPRSLATVALTLGLGPVGCQLLLDLPAPEQCRRDADCQALLGAAFVCGDASLCERPPAETGTSADAGSAGEGRASLEPRWACLRNRGRVTAAEASATAGLVHLRLLVGDYGAAGSTVVPDTLVAKTCYIRDLLCDDPVEADVTPDDEGYLNFEVPYGFDGYVLVEVEDRLPLLLQVNRPLRSELSSYAVSVVSAEVVSALGSRSADVVAIDDVGIVIFGFYDCDDAPAPGVKIVAVTEGGPAPFYFDGALPDQDLPASRLTSALTPDGSVVAVGGFFNVAPGIVSFEARLAETDDLISSFSVDVRAGHLTMVAVYPGEY